MQEEPVSQVESTGETGENTTEAILEVEKLDEGVKAEEEK